jgi:hypothetical protein
MALKSPPKEKVADINIRWYANPHTYQEAIKKTREITKDRGNEGRKIWKSARIMFLGLNL